MRKVAGAYIDFEKGFYHAMCIGMARDFPIRIVRSYSCCTTVRVVCSTRRCLYEQYLYDNI